MAGERAGASPSREQWMRRVAARYGEGKADEASAEVKQGEPAVMEEGSGTKRQRCSLPDSWWDATLLEPLVLPPSGDAPAPCELPAWCSAPDEGLANAAAEVWRVPARRSGAAPRPAEPLLLGCRPWVHFGRRHRLGPQGGRQPDVELATARASRKQAVLLRNWHGQVFLMDMGSTHGTFLNQKRLPAHIPHEWRAGVTAYFADRSTELFELRPAHLVRHVAAAPWAPHAPQEASRPAGGGITAIAVAAASAPPATFAGARRMMQSEFREEVKAQAEEVPAASPSPKASQSNQVEHQVEQKEEVPAKPLYPGEWDVPSQSEGKATDTKTNKGLTQGDAAQGTEAVADSRRPLEARLQHRIWELFGPDPSRMLAAQGPHYPCPMNGRNWQFSPWSGSSARFDPLRPAIVVTGATVKREETVDVTVRWLSANISAEDLWVRLTDAPPSVNEPGPAGHVHFDARPETAERCRGEATVRPPEAWAAPARLYVRVYSCRGLEFGGAFLGFEFGTSLRALSAQGDEWTLARAEAAGASEAKEIPAPQDDQSGISPKEVGPELKADNERNATSRAEGAPESSHNQIEAADAEHGKKSSGVNIEQEGRLLKGIGTGQLRVDEEADRTHGRAVCGAPQRHSDVHAEKQTDSKLSAKGKGNELLDSGKVRGAPDLDVDDDWNDGSATEIYESSSEESSSEGTSFSSASSRHCKRRKTSQRREKEKGSSRPPRGKAKRAESDSSSSSSSSSRSNARSRSSDKQKARKREERKGGKSKKSDALEDKRSVSNSSLARSHMHSGKRPLLLS